MQNETKILDGKVAIVTGASAPNGIGRATARQLAAAGAKVVITDIAGTFSVGDRLFEKQELLEGLAHDIATAGGQAITMELDVSDQHAVTRCVQRASSELGSLDIVVNNAGSLAGTGAFLDSSPDDWIESFRVNLLGVMLLCQTAIPALRRSHGGSIVNVGSTGSLGAEPGFGAYTTMKHGLVGLTKTIAAEHGIDRIRCNLVCPGYTDTDMHMAVNARLAKEKGVPLEHVKRERYEAVALRRAATPDEVAQAIVYLASPASAFVTGIALPIAGGVPFGI